MSIKQKLIWLSLGLFCILMTLVAFAPAAWLGSWLDQATKGQVVLGDVQGTIWHGSAVIGVATNQQDEPTLIAPGQFAWRLSPLLLLGQVELKVENNAVLQSPVYIVGNWRCLSIDSGALTFASERLVGLGAPFNTIRPSGEVVLSWETLTVNWLNHQFSLDGTMKLELKEMASALSPIKPLGSYLATLIWHGQTAEVSLKTQQGSMLLSGQGVVAQGRLKFSGKAQAQNGQEEQLATLLGLLGQRQGPNKNVIALELK
jgi:general secretion pathway protein N